MADSEASGLVASALVNSGRTSEAQPWLRRAAEGSDDPEVIAWAIGSALAGEDLETARIGLERLARRHDLGGELAASMLRLLGTGERTAQTPESIAALAPRPGTAVVGAESAAKGRAAPDSPWEGSHPRVSRVLVDLAGTLLR